MSYRTLFIDWDGTLSNSRFWERWKEDPENGAKYSILQDVLFRSNDAEALLVDWMVGRKSHQDVLGHIADTTGIDYEELVAELQHSAENMVFIDEEAPILIQKLRAKDTKVFIATDNMDTFSNWTVPALGLENMFDGILDSYKIGALKSEVDNNGNSNFFGGQLALLSLHPNETVLIDNSLSNNVVKRFGMRFLHVNNTSSATDHMRAILEKLL